MDPNNEIMEKGGREVSQNLPLEKFVRKVLTELFSKTLTLQIPQHIPSKFERTVKKFKVNTSPRELQHRGKEAMGPTRTIYMEALKDTEENVKAGRLKSYDDFIKELKESNEI